jgi:glucan phosphorylase
VSGVILTAGIVDKKYRWRVCAIVNSLKMNFSSLAGLDEMAEESFTALFHVAEVMIVEVTNGVTRWLCLERHFHPR